MKEHKKLYKAGKNWLAATVTVATLGVVGAQQTASADTTDAAGDATTQQTPTTQYTNAQNQGQQQLADLKQSQTTAEDHLASQIQQANDADAKKTDAAVAPLQKEVDDNYNAQVQKNNAALADKTAAVNQQVADQTKQENTSYQSKVNDQTTANNDAETKLKQENAAKLAEAQKHVYSPAQKEAMKSAAQQQKQTDDQVAQDKYTTTVTDAANQKTAAYGAAKQQLATDQADAKQAHADRIANQKATNEQKLTAAQQKYDDAVANAPKTKVKQATIVNDDQKDELNDAGLDNYGDQDGFDDSGKMWGPAVFGMSALGGAVGKGDDTSKWFKDNSKITKVSSEDQLPLTFTPGFLVYDGKNDTSEEIDYATGFTEDQKKRLNDLAVQWLNSMRDYFWNVLSPQVNLDKASYFDDYSTGLGRRIIKPQKGIKIQQLVTPDWYWTNVGMEIEEEREYQGYGYSHTVSDGTMNRVANFTTTIQQAFVDQGLTGNLATGECLYTIDGKTMLENEVDLFNKMQAMFWNEFVYTDDSKQKCHLMGHMHSALDPNYQFVTLSFQYGDNPTPGHGTAKILLFEFAGDPLSESDITTNGHIDTSNMTLVNTGVVDKIKKAQEVGYPDLTVKSVVDAKNNINTVKTIGEQKLAEIENEDFFAAPQKTYDEATKRADDTYDKTVKDAQTTRDQQLQKLSDNLTAKIKEINALPENTNELQQQLNDALTKLQQADAQKLADLKTTHDAALKKINDDAAKELADYKQTLNDILNSLDADKKAKIAELKQQHEQFVADNNAKLAALKAKDSAEYSKLAAQINQQLADLHAQLFPEETNHGSNGQAVVSGRASQLTLNNGQVVTLAAGNGSDVVAHESAKQSANGNSEKANELPQTGNQSSVAVALLGAMTAMFGLGLGLKKRY